MRGRRARHLSSIPYALAGLACVLKVSLLVKAEKGVKGSEMIQLEKGVKGETGALRFCVDFQKRL